MIDSYETSIEIMNDAAHLAEGVYGLDEQASIGYVVKKTLEATARKSTLDDSLRTVRDVLRLGNEIPSYRDYLRRKRDDAELERIENSDLNDCDLPAHVVCALNRNNIFSLSEAMEIGYDGLMQIRGIGEKSAEAIMTASSRMLAERVGDA